MLPKNNPGLNTEFIKYLLVVVTSPMWWPFVKTLWQELNDSLRDEGGLLGRTLNRDELARIDAERGHFESPLVSEPREPQGAPRRTGATPRERAPVDADGASSTSRGHGFRSSSGPGPKPRGFR